MTLELRGSARPTLQQALRWIGSRVDDIYGASIGKLEDIWMDPDSGEPLWLLVRDGRIGGRHTLVPFAQAASGAGHVWIPFEREVVRGAPAVRPSAPLSHDLSDTLRRYYAESGHPVDGASRADEAVREAPQQAPAHAEAPREYTHAFANTAATPSSAMPPHAQPRRPAPPRPEPAPQRPESRPRQPWSGSQSPAPGAPPEQPLPPMPPRPPAQSRTQTRPPRMQPPSQESFTAPRQPQVAPRPAQFEQPPHEPSQPDQTGPQPHQAAPPAASAEELHFAVGDGVDMELVGRLQFRGNIVRVQPLHQGDDGQH